MSGLNDARRSRRPLLGTINMGLFSIIRIAAVLNEGMDFLCLCGHDSGSDCASAS